MKFRPLHDRVLVRRAEEEERSAGGIIIPDTAKEKPMEGEIVAVGSNIEMQAPIFSYASSKAAATKVFTLLSKVLREKGYNIYIFCPGHVKTEMGSEDADLDVEESVEGMIKLIENLKSSQTGHFLRYNGEKVKY